MPKIGLLEAADRVLEPVEPHQAHERRRLAAGNDEPVEALQLLGLAHLDRLRAEAPQHRRVLAEVPLQGQDADPHATNSRFRLDRAAGIAARGSNASADEDEPREREDQRTGPVVRVALAESSSTGRENVTKGKSGKKKNPGGAMSDHLSAKYAVVWRMPHAPEDDPARTRQAVAERDVDQPTSAITIQSNVPSWKNQTRPPPIVRPAATWSQKPYGRDGPSSTAIPASRKASPTAIVTIAVQSPPPEMRSVTKNQIERGEEEDEQREAEDLQRDGRGDDCRELEHEQPEAEAVENAARRRVGQPAEPVQDRARGRRRRRRPRSSASSPAVTKLPRCLGSEGGKLRDERGANRSRPRGRGPPSRGSSAWTSRSETVAKRIVSPPR